MTAFCINAEQREQLEAIRQQLLDSPFKDNHATAIRMDWLLTLQPTQHIGTVFTMEALVQGSIVHSHVTLHRDVPAGTKLFAVREA